MSDTENLQAQITELNIRLNAMHGATLSILDIMCQAIEHHGIVKRTELAEALCNVIEKTDRERASQLPALSADAVQAQLCGRALLLGFVDSTLRRDAPKPKPGLRIVSSHD